MSWLNKYKKTDFAKIPDITESSKMCFRKSVCVFNTSRLRGMAEFKNM